MRWGSRRRPPGFNLAFLDIMACGLGAIILIFMLVKYHSAEPDVESRALQSALANAQNENDATEISNRALAAEIEKLKTQLRQQATRAAQTDDKRVAAATEMIDLTKQIARLQQQKAQQQSAAENIAALKKKPPRKTHEEHLLGLRVEGKRILILLDNSASMADERLVDIIKIKVADAATKKSAPKWRRAIAVAHWIIERIPDDSEYMIIHYNDSVKFLSGKKWLRGDDATARADALQKLDALYPRNATNLHAALESAQTAAPRATDIYVITDSLPTEGRDRLSALRKFKACGIGKKNTVSGACRRELFYAAVRGFGNDAKVNTVLLPIEGDPDAAYAYWLWSASTTGMMISPAGSWP